MPYVLSNRAVQKRWVPPHNVSAVPRKVRTTIPERFRYWIFEDTAKRRAARDQLVVEIKGKLKSKRRVDLIGRVAGEDCIGFKERNYAKIIK